MILGLFKTGVDYMGKMQPVGSSFFARIQTGVAYIIYKLGMRNSYSGRSVMNHPRGDTINAARMEKNRK